MQTETALPRTVPRFLWFFVRQRWLLFAIQFLLCLVWSFKEAFFPYFVKQIVNRLSSLEHAREEVLDHIALPLALLMGSWVAMELSMTLFRMINIKNIPRFRASIRNACFAVINRYPYGFFIRQFSGNIANKINEVPHAAERIVEILLVHVTSIGGASILSILLLWGVNPLFAVTALTWLMLHLTTIFWFEERCNNLASNHSNTIASLSGRIVDAITNIFTIRLFAQWEHERKHLAHFQEKEVAEAEEATWEVEKMKRVQAVFSVLFLFVMLGLLVRGWQYSIVTIGDFMLVPMLTFSLLGMIKWLGFEIGVAIREIGNIKAALEMLSNPIEEVKPSSKHPLLKVKSGKIVFEEASFRYPGQPPLFERLNLSISANQKVGLVGFSGVGKTTFVNLITRFFELESGRILIDGQDISQVSVDSIRQQVAMIPQDPYLFHRSLIENIRYGSPDATDAQVIEAATKAHCHPFISQMPEGYSTIVGERGVRLSTGQRQRIAIARAILKNAPILIMDEPTSALDYSIERQIQESLAKLIKGKTVIVIAHRLSTLREMDRLLIFRDGYFEEGTPSKILVDPSPTMTLG